MEKRMFSEDTLRPFHQEQIRSMQLPAWMHSFSCSECGEPMEPDSIRALSLCLNAKHIGNFVISVHCRKCNAGYDLMVEGACKNVTDFIGLLSATEIPCPADKFVPEHKLTPHKNNLVEKYLKNLPAASSEGL